MFRSRITFFFLTVATVAVFFGTWIDRSRADVEQDPSRDRRVTQTTAPKPTPSPGDPVQDDDVIRVDTNLTNILFTSMDKNKRFVTTLRQEDVRILEDGKQQEIFSFYRQTDLPLTLAILIDTSASEERTLPSEKLYAGAFIDQVIRPNKDEAAIVSFTGEATLEQGLTGNAARLRRALDRVEFIPPSGYIGGGQTAGTPPISGRNQQIAGSTAIWDAIVATTDDVLKKSSDKTRRAVILLTDGVDTQSRWKMSDAIDSALKVDAVIYSIGIGDYFFGGVDEGVLRKVSERTGGRAYFPKDERDLREAFKQIQDELRSQYLIAYSPTNKSRDGAYRRVQIELSNPEFKNLKLTYRQGYFAKTQ